MLQCDTQRPCCCSEWAVIWLAVQTIYQKALSGTRLSRWSSSQPYFVESISGGDWRSAAFHIATWRWHLWTFSVNGSVAGGMEQSFTDDAPCTLPCFWAPHVDHAFCHGVVCCYLAICSTHEFSGLCLNRFNLSMHITNAEEWETPFLGNFDNRCLAYAMQWRYRICTRESVNC